MDLEILDCEVLHIRIEGLGSSFSWVKMDFSRFSIFRCLPAR